MEIKEKLLSNSKLNKNCWEWQRAKHRQGYGHIFVEGKIQLTHRVSWTIFRGPIPEGKKVCHTCDNPCCINPDHLFLGSQKDNIKDMFSKKRKIHTGSNHPNAKLNIYQVRHIRKLLKEGKTQEFIRKKFGISNGYVGAIKHYRRWKEN